MSPRLRRLSGDEVIEAFRRFGFQIRSQRGDHVKLTRLQAGSTQTLTVPRHRELDIGTLRAIIRQASRYISMDELEAAFKA